MTVKDFAVGQTVFVHADQGVRKGVVTKLGRTRVTVRHPRNLKGEMVERPYGLERIVVSHTPSDYLGTYRGQAYWKLTYATGDNGTYPLSGPVKGLPWRG